MKENLKQKIKSNKFLYIIARRIQNKSFINSIKKKIRGKNNKIQYNFFCILKRVKFDIIGDNNTIVILENSKLNNVNFHIRGNGHNIVINKNVIFSKGGDIWFEDNNGYLYIGNDTTFEEAHIAVTEDNCKVIIGEDCMFAYDIEIRTGDSHSILDVTTNERTNRAKDIILGSHIWVATHSTILKNSRIQSNSVIATRSVVTKQFQKENVLIGGCPAKILKENVDWNRKRL